MNLILLFVKILSHWDKAFKAENSNSVLLVLKELLKEREKFIDEVTLFELGCKNLKHEMYGLTPILEAHALLIMGVSSLQSSTNFFLSFSF